MANRVLCKIRVLIKFEFHNHSLFSGSLFILFYRGTGTKCYCRIRGLYETSQLHNPISFQEVHLFFVLCGKMLLRMLKRVLCQIRVLLAGNTDRLIGRLTRCASREAPTTHALLGRHLAEQVNRQRMRTVISKLQS